jgi:hypothetical protein
VTLVSDIGPAVPVTPSDVGCPREVLRWAEEYLSQPHDQLGRPGAVCPFVPPSINADTFYVAMHHDVDDDIPAASIEQLLIDYLEVFHRIPPPGPQDDLLKTIVVVFPAMSRQRALVLDTVHERMKSFFVERGMMIGQFHPLCTSTAVRNPAFANKTSPVPLVALRRLALHDILFLADRADWFSHYRALYGANFNDRTDCDEHGFAALYQRARTRFSTPPDN